MACQLRGWGARAPRDGALSNPQRRGGGAAAGSISVQTSLVTRARRGGRPGPALGPEGPGALGGGATRWALYGFHPQPYRKRGTPKRSLQKFTSDE